MNSGHLETRKQTQVSLTNVTWIPAHPIYGAVSMRRYWQALSESTQEGDPFRIHSVIQPTDIGIPPGIQGMAARYWQRKYGYPAVIRRRFTGEIAHVLDHSWADMLPHVPPEVLKVVTVHDLIPLRFSAELSAAQAARFKSWVAHVTDAHAVIAVSEYTKKEIQHFFQVPGEKIRVVACGVDLPTETALSKPITRPDAEPGTLVVGSIGSTISRKNLAILPEAFSRFAARTGRRIVLVRVGPSLPIELADELRNVLGPAGLVELGRLSDAEVGDFYRAMDVVVVPSLYEGFGLPVLEAMAWCIPVISSNTTSLPEVGGDVALYFDPHSPEELATALAKVANESVPLRQIEEGYKRAKRLSWRNCLEGIYQVYEEVREKSPTLCDFRVHPSKT